jgi:hypothetical protein
MREIGSTALHGEEFSNYAIYKTLNGSKPDA